MSRWFRWYDGTSRDGKLQAVARNASVTVCEVLAVWVTLLEDASNDAHRGIAVRGPRYYSLILGCLETTVVKVMHGLEELGLIKIGKKNEALVLNWGKRQFETDRRDGTNARRQARYRERKRNAPVTAPNGPDTETDTEKKEHIWAAPIEAEFEMFWKAYPKRDGPNPKAPARKRFLAFCKAGVDPEAIIAGARRCAAKDAANVGTRFIPQAVKWLNDRRWEDYGAEQEQTTNGVRVGFYADFGSPELVAWDAYERRTGTSTPRDKRGGWEFPTQWPPE